MLIDHTCIRYTPVNNSAANMAVVVAAAAVMVVVVIEEGEKEGQIPLHQIHSAAAAGTEAVP